MDPNRGCENKNNICLIVVGLDLETLTVLVDIIWGFPLNRQEVQAFGRGVNRSQVCVVS